MMAFSACLTLCMLALGARGLGELLGLLWRSYLLMPLLNLLPLLLPMLLLYFLTANAALSASCIGLLGIIMAIVNRVKVQMRGDPLLYRDLSLIDELMGIAGGVGGVWLFLAMLIVAALIGMAVSLCVKVKTKGLCLRERVAGVLVCTITMAGCGYTLYRSDAVYNALPVMGSFYNLTNVHASKGNLYCFFYDLLTNQTRKPEGYDSQVVSQVIAVLEEENSTDSIPAAQPHIIMVMGESFSTLSDSETLDFPQGQNPLETFHALGAKGIEGTLVVPGRGGGTADTEFDVLTGGVTRYLRTAPYAYRLIARPTEALPSMLKKAGYQTFALHPGFRWFYNRQNVYRYLGFDEAVFEDSFPREAYEGSFITEKATFDRFLEMFEARRTDDPQAPIFAFCLTIQNHYAYFNRFLTEGEYNFASAHNFSDADKNNLSNYFQGMRYADEQLARLAAYLEALDEPAILVYFGDHLPAMDESIYDALIPGADAPEGSLTLETRLYRVPFLIWQNSAAQKDIDLLARANAAAMPEDEIISSNYLGAYVLELLGYEGLSPFFAHVNQVRADYPVLLEQLSFPRDGKPVEEEAPVRLAFYRHWMYYRTMEK